MKNDEKKPVLTGEECSEKHGKRCKKEKEISVRHYLIAGFGIFLSVALAVTWFFQVYLLNTVFFYVKKRELKQTTQEIRAVLATEQLKPVIDANATDGLICVQVFQVIDDTPTIVYWKDGTIGDAGVGFIPMSTVYELYQKAMDRGGTYQTGLVFGGREVKRDIRDDLFQRKRQDASGNSEKTVNLVQITVCEDVGGDEYIILLRTATQPLSTTTETLKGQFFWIAAILLAVALIMTVPLSKMISKPLRKMNEAAKELATGNYNVNFSGSGYRETEMLAESLNFAAAELSKTDSLQKELIANISHDLRTPLTMIRGYGEAMRDIPGENTPENVQVIIDEAEHLSELVNDLLDLSRIQSGVRSPVMEFFDLTLAIRETINRYEAFTRNKGYTIHLEADREVPVFADRSMILQVLYNLLNNAINYTGDDLSVTVRQTVIGEKVRIDVSDTGAGIPEEQIPLIWDRYYKVDKVHRIARVGTGLGLSIVKGILEKHGAAYGVDSRIGEGSDFWFELPVSEVPETDFREQP